MSTNPQEVLRSRLQEAYGRMARECRYRPAALADQATGELCPEEQQRPFEAESDRWALRWLARDEERVEEAIFGAADFRTRHINAVQVEAIRATYSGRIDLAQDLALLAAKMLKELPR